MKPIRSFDDLPDVRHTYEYCADLAAILMPEVNDHAKPFDLESTKPLAATRSYSSEQKMLLLERACRVDRIQLFQPKPKRQVNDHAKPFDLESTQPLAAIIDTRPRQWNRRRRAREETSGLARPNDHGKPNRT